MVLYFAQYVSHDTMWFEPTDIHKAAKPFRLESWKTLDFISPNFNELRIMCQAAGFSGDLNLDFAHLSDEKVIEKATAMGIFLAENVRTVIATLGHLGVIICRKNASDKPFFSVDGNGHIEPLADESAHPEAHYFPAPLCQPVSVSGAGDCWNSGFIAAALQGKPETACVEAGFNAALCSLAVTSAVPRDIKI